MTKMAVKNNYRSVKAYKRTTQGLRKFNEAYLSVFLYAEIISRGTCKKHPADGRGGDDHRGICQF